MTAPITRVTMIKLPSPDHHTIALKGFQNFTETQQKSGRPYIISMEAGPANGSAADQGYNFVTKSVFKSLEDMRYYETVCEAHNVFKGFLRENAPVAGLMTVWFQAGFSYVE